MPSPPVSHLGVGKFNMDVLVTNARNALLSNIGDLEGKKAIVWDSELVSPVTVLVKVRQLNELGAYNMYALSSNVANIDAQHVIFVVRPGAEQMNLVADYVLELSRQDTVKGTKRELRILFIPRTSKMCERQLETRGVLGSVDIKSANFDLFPFDTDLLSMEQEHVFKEVVVENDPSKLMDIAIALRGLEEDYGPFPHIIGRGSAAKTVTDNYQQLKALDTKGNLLSTSSIHHVVLLDRQIDLITPMVTQLTYEGLIDEMFGINNTSVSLPPERFTQEEQHENLTSSANKKVVYLNSTDDLYADLRDRNFNGIGPCLRRKAQAVAQQIEKRHDTTKENLKMFVNQLPQIQATKKSLALHTTIAELIKERTDTDEFLVGLKTEQELLLNGAASDKVTPAAIEDAISKKEPFLKVLRLICLQCLVKGGLKQLTIDHYRRELVQTYGLQVLTPLSNLEKAGLFKATGAPRNYAGLNRTFRLIIEDDSEIEPTDICFVYSIYAPLSIRLVQNFKTWGTSMKDVLDMVPGPTVEHLFKQKTKSDERQMVLVFFIGGCTFAEVSALRFLSQREDSNVEYIIATTKLINGNTFLKSIMSVDDDFP